MLKLILWILLLPIYSALAIECLDNDNRPVEWFVVYKFPDSYNYAFMVPSSKSWENSSQEIQQGGMIMNTFTAMYDLAGNSSSVYAMYNDEKSGGDFFIQAPRFGHMKGAFAFDSSGSGFWLIHSVPKLSDTDGSYAYPPTGRVFGQHFFCVTLSITYLDPLINQLAVSKPWIQDFYVSPEIDEDYPNVTLLIKHEISSFVKYAVHDFCSLHSALKMTHFSKASSFEEDLYSELVAPNLEVALNVETWQHGSKEENEPSICKKPESSVYNVRSVSFPNLGVNFSNLLDHSKWAVSLPSSLNDNPVQKWICLGDINRQFSQFRRGGGTMCMQNLLIWSAFSSIVSEVEPCKPSWTSAGPSE